MTEAFERIFVAGGGGYIGRHVVHALVERSVRVVVLDDVIRARAREAIAEGAILEVGDADDRTLAAAVLRRHRCQAVLQFAGFIVISESVRDPRASYGCSKLALERMVRDTAPARRRAEAHRRCASYPRDAGEAPLPRRPPCNRGIRAELGERAPGSDGEFVIRSPRAIARSPGRVIESRPADRSCGRTLGP